VTFRVPIERGPRGALAGHIAEHVSRAARSAVDARHRFVICIAGGSVAESCLPLIASADLPWPQVHIVWADERAVPFHHPDSNAGEAMRLWAGSALEMGAIVHPMRVDPSDLDHSAAEYERELADVLNGGPLDFTLLGVGDDGHVASLFPGRSSLEETQHRVVVEHASPKPPPKRLSLSLATLAASRELVIAAFGASKEAVMAAATSDADATTPVARLIRLAAHVTVMRDD
jgi:6-phosphogluconolactonase